jgi:hypothetical protein
MPKRFGAFLFGAAVLSFFLPSRAAPAPEPTPAAKPAAKPAGKPAAKKGPGKKKK